MHTQGYHGPCIPVVHAKKIVFFFNFSCTNIDTMSFSRTCEKGGKELSNLTWPHGTMVLSALSFVLNNCIIPNNDYLCQVKGLYRGATSSFIGMSVESSLIFGIYSQSKKALQVWCISTCILLIIDLQKLPFGIELLIVWQITKCCAILM